MELRHLGRTGVRVSPLCLGALMFAPWGNDNHADSSRSSAVGRHGERLGPTGQSHRQVRAAWSTGPAESRAPRPLAPPA
jgi:aryl-alcohol dehydrogenase-like predicted oxidoreductase